MSEQVCYTFEAAIEMAIKMEEEGFRHYLDAIRKVQDKHAQEILRDAALDELKHKHQLENGSIDFYKRMAEGCSGAPMAPVFARLLADETRHLQSLEDLYERHFMPEN